MTTRTPNRTRDPEIAELLRTGATYAQIRQQLGPVSQNDISRVRREQNIPVQRPANGRTPEQTYAHHTAYDDEGHAHWGGAWSGRMPTIHIPATGKRKTSALRVAFRMTTGREPTGYVRPTCGRPWCIAALHLKDRPTRDGEHPAPTLHQAIAHMLEQGASDWQITRTLNTTTSTITHVRQATARANAAFEQTFDT
jgi:uncharacterized protein YerC